MARIVLMQYVHGMPRFCQQFVDECSCLRFLSVKLFTRSPYLSHIKWFFSPLPSIPLDSLNAKQRAPFFRYFMLLNKCVIRLWLRCDKLIQTKWFSSCHIGISLIRNTRFLQFRVAHQLIFLSAIGFFDYNGVIILWRHFSRFSFSIFFSLCLFFVKQNHTVHYIIFRFSAQNRFYCVFFSLSAFFNVCTDGTEFQCNVIRRDSIFSKYYREF